MFTIEGNAIVDGFKLKFSHYSENSQKEQIPTILKAQTDKYQDL